MEMESSFSRINVILKAISKMISPKDLYANKRQKIIYLRGHVSKMIFMEQVELFTMMSKDIHLRCILENFTRVQSMDTGNILGLTVLVTKDSGITAR